MHKDIVDTMIDQILADSVMAPGHHRHLKFRTHAISAGHQRLTASRGGKHAAKRADFTQYAGSASCADKFFHRAQRAHLVLNIHTRRLISRTLGLHICSLLFNRQRLPDTCTALRIIRRHHV